MKIHTINFIGASRLHAVHTTAKATEAIIASLWSFVVTLKNDLEHIKFSNVKVRNEVFH